MPVLPPAQRQQQPPRPVCAGCNRNSCCPSISSTGLGCPGCAVLACPLCPTPLTLFGRTSHPRRSSPPCQLPTLPAIPTHATVPSPPGMHVVPYNEAQLPWPHIPHVTHPLPLDRQHRHCSTATAQPNQTHPSQTAPQATSMHLSAASPHNAPPATPLAQTPPPHPRQAKPSAAVPSLQQSLACPHTPVPQPHPTPPQYKQPRQPLANAARGPLACVHSRALCSNGRIQRPLQVCSCAPTPPLPRDASPPPKHEPVCHRHRQIPP